MTESIGRVRSDLFIVKISAVERQHQRHWKGLKRLFDVEEGQILNVKIQFTSYLSNDRPRVSMDRVGWFPPIKVFKWRGILRNAVIDRINLRGKMTDEVNKLIYIFNKTIQEMTNEMSTNQKAIMWTIVAFLVYCYSDWLSVIWHKVLG